jgi:Na+/proline symporter
VFTIWDWGVVALYFAAMAGIGVHFSRKNRDFKDFMFGGGNMPWLAVGISLIATSVSASTFLGNPADAFAKDMRLLMLGGGSLLAIAVTGLVFIPRFRASGVHSAYELLERRFSRPVRLLAATLYSLHLLLRTALLWYLAARPWPCAGRGHPPGWRNPRCCETRESAGHDRPWPPGIHRVRPPHCGTGTPSPPYRRSPPR